MTEKEAKELIDKICEKFNINKNNAEKSVNKMFVIIRTKKEKRREIFDCVKSIEKINDKRKFISLMQQMYRDANEISKATIIAKSQKKIFYNPVKNGYKYH